MKSRWWIAASLLVALTLLLQPGCGGGGNDLPSEATQDVDPASDPANVEVVPAN